MTTRFLWMVTAYMSLAIDQFAMASHILQIYYINTNEIPGELSRENLISSHVKITCYLHMWKYHRCYGFIINRAFHTKKLFKWNGFVFHWCLYNKINRTLHGRLEIRNFSSCVEKIFHSFAALVLMKYFSTLKQKFCISARPCYILYVSSITSSTEKMPELHL